MDGDQRPAWTPKIVFYNTLGTLLGAVFGMAALLIALVALLR